MDPFKKLPGYRKAPPGLERKILRLVPKVFLVGTVLTLLPSLIARIWTMDDAPWVINKFITTIDIYAFGLLTVLWTALFTVGVGAFTVMVMKGPAYVADAYPLPDADQPRVLKPAPQPTPQPHDTEPANRYADPHSSSNTGDRPKT